MFLKIITFKKVKDGYSHWQTAIHRADSLEVIDEKDENDKRGLMLRKYIITRNGQSFTVLSKKSNKELRIDVFVENENGDTIGKY